MRRGRTCEAVQPSLKFHNAFQQSPNPKACSITPKSKRADRHDGDSVNRSRQGHPALPKSDLVRSLNRSENELYYLTHWGGSCLQALDCCFQRMTHADNTNQLLKHSILALSACNLSRSRPEQESTRKDTTLTYRPHRQHQATSQYYYTSALGQVAKIISSDASPWQTSQETLLAVLVVFCYIESTMGTFPGFYCHAQGIAKFIQATESKNTHVATTTDMGYRLLSAYLHSRYQSWWRRFHFSSFEYQCRQPSMALADDVVSMLWSVDAKRTLVTAILCESYRLNVIASLRQWEDRNSDASEYISMLETESRKLDDWESRLLPYELPTEPSNNTEDLFMTIRPMPFTSHDNAMNYAYYVVARIMQCTDNLSPSLHTVQDDTKTTKYWLTILLRIIAGLQKPTCTKLNVYSIGISSLLLSCLPRCRDVSIGSWVEAWLLDLLASSVLEEGSFPVAQALAVAALVNTERDAGNEICAIGLVEDDGGGGGKYDSYSSQYIDRVVVKGWQRDRPGNCWSKEVSLWGSSDF